MSRRTLAALVLAAAVLPAGAASAAPVDLHATLNGRSEVPRSGSDATGAAELRVAGDRRSIHYELRATGLSGPPMAAHVHLGRPGEAGGILLSIATERFRLPAEGRLTRADVTPVGDVRTFRQAVRQVIAGNTYVNIHTERHPGGEIRGQVRVER